MFLYFYRTKNISIHNHKKQIIMKFVSLALFLFPFFITHAQTIPEATTVSIILQSDVGANSFKKGDPAPFVVAEDVKINGKVVIPANAKVRAVVTLSTKSAPHRGEGELRVEILDVMAMDGSTVKLQDCWLFTTGANNLKKHEALIVKGTRKNCGTIKQ